MEFAIIIIIVLLYGIFHGFHARGKWDRHRHYPWYRRIWVSIPGPFHTRIGRRL
jgi:hypothetical protein